MEVLSLVGARPQFVKVAPISRAVAAHSGARAAKLRHEIVHTGQHYDREMSDVFFDELAIPKPLVNLGVGSGSHARQTGAMLVAIEAFLQERRPDVVMVYGDTNTTLAGALAATKLHIPVAHVEAGLRSLNRRMPEEINRIATDSICDLLFAPTQGAMNNLSREGRGAVSVFTGDVMFEAVQMFRDIACRRSTALSNLGIGKKAYILVTVHRAENVNPTSLGEIMSALAQIAREQMPVVFPVHPRTAVCLRDMSGVETTANLKVIEPVAYFDLLALLAEAAFVLTDSGGVQKEAMFLNTPCLTLRRETEWPETVESGANRLVGTKRDDILAGVEACRREGGETAPSFLAAAKAKFGAGHASRHIVDSLLAHFDGRSQN